MSNLIKNSFLAFLALAPAISSAEVRTTRYILDNPKIEATVIQNCTDFTIPNAYDCIQQEVLVKVGNSTYSYMPEIPTDKRSKQRFLISGLQWADVQSGEFQFLVINYIDIGGSPTRAEERFETVDFGDGNKLVPVSGLMTYEEFGKDENERVLTPFKQIRD